MRSMEVSTTNPAMDEDSGRGRLSLFRSHLVARCCLLHSKSLDTSGVRPAFQVALTSSTEVATPYMRQLESCT